MLKAIHLCRIANPRHPWNFQSQGNKNLGFEIVSKSVVYKIKIKQKVFNIINSNFSKHINVFCYLYMMFSEAKHFVLMLSYLQQFYGN